MYALSLITLEILFIATIIVFLYRLKGRHGLPILYIFVGSNLYLQEILAQSIYLPIFGGYLVSPGSMILFSSSLFAILLIYLKEDVPQTRTLIYGTVLSSITLTALSAFTDYQITANHLNISQEMQGIFHMNVRFVIVGAMALILDSFLIIVIYEFLFFKMKQVGLLGRILGTMLIVLYFDALFFTTGSFWDDPTYKVKLISQIIGKTYSGILYGSFLYLYLVYVDQNRYLKQAKAPEEIKDIFNILTYREKYEMVKTEKEEQEKVFSLEQQRSRETLQKSEEKFRQIAENINEVFWMTNPDKNQMIYISPSYENIWGHTCESLYEQPKTWLDAIHPEDRPRILGSLEKQIRGEYDEEYRIVRSDGSIRWIRDRAFPIQDNSGKIYRITGIAEDITKRKVAEQEIALLSHAIGSINECISITDEENNILYVNKAFSKIYGYERQELIGKNIGILGLAKDDRTLLDEILQSTLQGGWNGELINYKKDGSPFPIFLSTSAIRNDQNRYIALVGVAMDISERKRAEEEQKRLQDELTKKKQLAAIGETMENIAHSMKNIFSALNSSLDLIEKSLKEKDWNMMESSFEILRNSSLHLYLLLMNLLDYSKNREPVFEKIKVSSLFGEAIRMLKPSIKKKTIEFEYTIEPGAEVIFSDLQRLRRNLMNLGCNAIDAISASGKIRFTSSKRDRKDFDMPEQRPSNGPDKPLEKVSVIEVSDTGGGIPRGVMNNIFEPFFSTKGSKGTGLGLSSVKQIMEEQGGRIFVESVEGKGTTFRLVFSNSQNSPIPS